MILNGGTGEAAVEEPWIERWQEGRIGWHESEGNASLRKHWRVRGCRVLVPMCGKTPDMKWLADQGNQVVGVELSELAVRAFFAEQGLEFTVRDIELPAYQTTDKSITIYCGDFFDLHFVRCDAHYDRGALVATPANRRAAYAAHTNSLLEEAAEQLVITLEYEQSVTEGPPFSISPDELLSYWPKLVCIDSHDDIDNGPPKFLEAGLTEMMEMVWRSP
jgi:thiopurine S-methyltransferase